MISDYPYAVDQFNEQKIMELLNKILEEEE